MRSMRSRVAELNRFMQTLTVGPGQAAQIGVLGLLFLLMYLPVFRDLVRVWMENPNYSHGFLVPCVSAYFVWHRRAELENVSICPNNWGALVLGAGVVAFFAGTVGAGSFALRVSMILCLAGLILFLAGSKALNVLVLPVGFLFFMIPLPEIIFTEITFPLQLMAAEAAAFCLEALAIPVLREGNIIFLATITLEVVEACSGIRSLMSLLALGVVFAYATQRRMWKRITLVLSAVPIAIVANAVRVSGTGVLAHYFGPDIANGFFHSFSGMVLFAVAFLLLVLVGLALSRVRGANT